VPGRGEGLGELRAFAGRALGVPIKLKDFCTTVERLAWANANGCPTRDTPNTCRYAAAGGHVEVLRFAREQLQCPWDVTKLYHAALFGHLAVLRWAQEHGCPLDSSSSRMTRCAAQGGHLEVLKWLREHDCPWDSMTCFLAAQGGHLDVLQRAREHGCPWAKLNCISASRLVHDRAAAAAAAAVAAAAAATAAAAAATAETLAWVQQLPE